MRLNLVSRGVMGGITLAIVLLLAGTPGPVSAGMGDINSDGAVNVFDALIVLQTAVGLHDPPESVLFKAAADVAPMDACNDLRGDGTVDVFDALAILRHAVNLDDWSCTTQLTPGMSVQRLTDSPVYTLYAGGMLSLAFDTSDRPHLIIGGDHVYHYYHDGTRWRSERIPVPDGSNPMKLFIDSRNVMHCLFRGASPSLISSATKESGRWAVETIAADEAVVDAGGTLHTISYDQGTNAFTYRKRSGGSWVSASFSAATGTVGVSAGLATAVPRLMKLAVDVRGAAHLVFCRTVTDGVEDTILQYASNAGGTWIVERIHRSISTSPSAIDLVVDGSGAPHIAYGYSEIVNGTVWCTDPCDLRGQVDYLTRSGGKWLTSKADSIDYVTGVSLNLDSQGAAHLMIDTSALLQYDTKQGSTWTPVAVAEGLGMLKAFSAALDSTGRVHLGHLSQDGLRYASYVDGQWQVEDVSIPQPTGEYPDLAADPAGRLHVSYWDAATQTLQYATNGPGFWTTETVSGNVAMSKATSLAVDAGGRVHIVYNDIRADRLMHAVKSSGGWSVEPVAASPYGRPAMAVDARGTVHVVYRLWYARNNLWYAENASGSWVTSKVADIGWWGDSLDVTVSPDGAVAICLDVPDSSSPVLAEGIWLLTKAPSASSWTFDTVFGGAVITSYCTVVADDAGALHLAYRQKGEIGRGNQLIYARKGPAGWENQVVDTGLVDRLSLALDPARNPYLSYYDQETGLVNYAFKTGSGWQSKPLVNLIVYDKPDFLAPLTIDPAGALHAAYFDHFRGDLNVVHVPDPARLP